MSLRTSSLCVLAGTGLLLGLIAAPAHAAPPPCAAGAAQVTVDSLNDVYEGPLWARLGDARLAALDRDRDGLLCVRVVPLPSAPPGLQIPTGESNVLVLVVDNPGGRD